MECKAYVDLGKGIFQYIFYSGWSLPSYIMANLQHKPIPQEELETFRNEWIAYHKELERKLNHV